jgi:hypothetical protein
MHQKDILLVTGVVLVLFGVRFMTAQDKAAKDPQTRRRQADHR